MSEYKGVDVSTYQGKPDWAAAKSSGLNFAILRAGYGKGNADSSFVYNAQNCNKIGLPIGVYWFSYAYTPAMAKAEADYCLDLIKPYTIEYPVFFDFEYDSSSYAKKQLGRDLTKDELVAIARAFLSRVEERGYYAGNYTNIDYLSRGFSELTAKYDTWLAQWSSKPSKSCGMWQYSSKGSVAGISGSVDMDVAYVDYPSVIRKAGLNGLAPAKEQATPTEVTPSSNPNGGVTADDVIAVMASWVGKARSAGTHKDIIDTYNSYTPLPVGYKVTYTDSYCDAGVSAAFIKLGAAELIGGPECGVERHVKLFQKAGIWEEDGTVTPEKGWLIVYNWDKASQPNDGSGDHIGIVEYVQGGYVHTIECNMNGGLVARRVIAVGHGYIRGYAKPKYAVSTASQTITYPYGKASATTGVIKKGSSGSSVKAVQYALNSLGFGTAGTKAPEDGRFGSGTDEAVKAYQKARGLEVDGEVGQKTREAFKNDGY